MNKKRKKVRIVRTIEKPFHTADIDENGVVHIKNKQGALLAYMPLEQYVNLLMLTGE